MTRATFAANPAYVAHEQQLIQLHHLMAAGEGDSEAADSLREQMETTWRELNKDEQERLGGLSGDLYMLGNEETYEEIEDSEQVQQLAVELQAALERGEWKRGLELLRKRPPSTAPARLAELRAIAYHQLHQPAAAVEFARYAVSHDPRSYHGKFLLLDLLDELDHSAEAITAAASFSVDGAGDVWWLVRYTALLLRQNQDRQLLRDWRRVRAYLDWVLRRPEVSAELPPQLRFFGTLSLAIAHDRTGDEASARHWIERFLALEPVSSEARVLQLRIREEAEARQYSVRWTVLVPELLSGVQRQPPTVPTGANVYQLAA